MENTKLEVPRGESLEDIKAREQIISDVYRKWYEANPTKAVYNQNQEDFSKVLIMECPLIGIGIAKLTVGVKK